jgi:hypothetical protein
MLVYKSRSTVRGEEPVEEGRYAGRGGGIGFRDFSLSSGGGRELEGCWEREAMVP